MQTTTYTENQDSISAIRNGLLHSTLIPLICIYFFSWYGLFYLLIPTTFFLTIKKDGKGKTWFFTLLFIYAVTLVSGFIDDSNASLGGF